MNSTLGRLAQFVFFILSISGCHAQFARSLAMGVQQYRSSGVSMSHNSRNSLVRNCGRSTVSQFVRVNVSKLKQFVGRSTVSQFVRVQVSKRSIVSQFGRGDVPKLKRVVGLQVWAFNSIAVGVCRSLRTHGIRWCGVVGTTVLQFVRVNVPKLKRFVGLQLLSFNSVSESCETEVPKRRVTKQTCESISHDAKSFTTKRSETKSAEPKAVNRQVLPRRL